MTHNRKYDLCMHHVAEQVVLDATDAAKIVGLWKSHSEILLAFSYYRILIT